MPFFAKKERFFRFEIGPFWPNEPNAILYFQ